MNPETHKLYGPEFPICTVRDDVRIHRLVLDSLGIKQVAACIGGSMGGMLVLEWAMLGREYVRCIVPLATSARHSAWCISWGEAQRQCIYSDPKYDDGYYKLTEPPISGLSAARMSALLTYRSRNSFESRFGRNAPEKKVQPVVEKKEEDNVSIHNDGSRNRHHGRPRSNSNESITSNGSSASNASRNPTKSRPQHYFTAQSYLRYQGEKFISRFDANCYISITRKLDTHDLSRDRLEFADLSAAVKSIQQPALVIGITSDGLFTYSEQIFIARHIPDSQLHRIESMEGHDAFLLEFQEIDDLIKKFLREKIPDVLEGEVEGWELAEDLGDWTGSSVFGEAEDVTQW
ncbi:hypothetical protein BABINDRAFT_162500 [Babjeviella inositovora NRRL Y-12698]|uniref:AB hydrolase-1 domain-containing protein n=1 Tax=Babjeviella inositovora NRRL Y-12698 TaxID=984486 RepID=A0A1E3QMH0_9ASCO|nr:uncharacterized protein BABINDRAFT_162500 [Babjeviella inositovora NRRL Y-12698]ODQ78818.1 hypothetical protein BABINDRAFT_162500 [Babjeviella inositovora NRRL Y-12698]